MRSIKENGKVKCSVCPYPWLMSRIFLSAFNFSCLQPAHHPFLSLGNCWINMVGEGRQKNLAKAKKKEKEGTKRKGQREKEREKEN